MTTKILSITGVLLKEVDGANLEGANLRGANLKGAYLKGAYLKGANLYGANLYGANLKVANLYGANLYGANLYGANLYGANLKVANLRGALYGDFVIANLILLSCVAEWGSMLVYTTDKQELRVVIGCRHFSMAEAQAHWKTRVDRKGTRLALRMARLWAKGVGK